MEESKEKVSMSEEKGKISVIVPVYQAEKYLAKALDSVISQDYENWELFLLVRKSSDQSEKIARDYEKKYDSIHMIERGENKAGEARNQGLEKAQGEYEQYSSLQRQLKEQQGEQDISVLLGWQNTRADKK